MNGEIADLIFDVGARRGEDTAHYLKRGFRVVAVECEPLHVEELRTRFASAIADKRLSLIDRAVTPEPGPVTFYRNRNNADWGTIFRTWADRNLSLGTEIEELTVNTISPAELFAEFGIPHYLKIDVEGADMQVLEGISAFEDRPSYISLESNATSFDGLRREFAAMEALGYHEFKLSAQHAVPEQQIPSDTPHGRYAYHAFEFGNSGLFGEDLPGPWLPAREAIAEYKAVFVMYDLARAIHSGLLKGSLAAFRTAYGHQAGWYDTHARHPKVTAGSGVI